MTMIINNLNHKLQNTRQMGEVIITPSWVKDNLIYALTFLFGTSILPLDENKIAGVMIGGLFLIIAFVNLAENKDRGESTKLVYTIGRYGVATILFIVTGIQLYLYFTESAVAHLSIYSLVVDSALIAYLVAFKPSNTTFGKKISKIIGYTLVLVVVNALQKVCIETFPCHSPYLSYEINWGMFVLLCIMAIAGVICIKIGHKTTEKNTPDDISMIESTNRFYTSSKKSRKHRISFKRLSKNIALSFGLLVYIICSLTFVDEGDALTACGVIFYIPCFIIMLFYYLRLIWSNAKVTGDKILLLPLLQKVNLFKTYNDNLKGKKELAKTVLPFLLSMIICPLLTSILYENVLHRRSQNGWLLMLLLIPPIILVISIARSFVQSWVSQNYHSEDEE